ncbi:MAG: hypothetical protein HY706_05545 [Candidatus Hydrogenedentes bacterium]|nr:hypothetical protein [Candidatus Hydrogenedentota bacterium]
MSDVRQICVFYSQGPHFERTVRCIKERHPSAAVTTIVPKGYPFPETLRSDVQEIIETKLIHYSIQDVGSSLRLVRNIRRARFDLFVTMFDSPQLRLLAALTGARAAAWVRVDGGYFEIPTSFLAALFCAVFRGLVGRATYALLWVIIRCLPVRAAKS